MRYLVLLLVLILITPYLTAQSILINANLGYSNHISSYDLDNPPKTPVVANIGTYYEDAPIIGLKALYLFNDLRTNSTTIFSGVLFEYSSFSAEVPELILGEDLSITSLGFSIGLKKGLSEENPVAFLNIAFEFLNSFYNGKNNFYNEYYSESTYNSETSIRGTVGFEFLTSKETPLIIGIGSSFGYGTATRDNIEFYDGEKYLESLAPTGDKVLPDVILNFFINVSYLIEF